MVLLTYIALKYIIHCVQQKLQILLTILYIFFTNFKIPTSILPVSQKNYLRV